MPLSIFVLRFFLLPFSHFFLSLLSFLVSPSAQPINMVYEKKSLFIQRLALSPQNAEFF
jgi:hypothetical protein